MPRKSDTKVSVSLNMQRPLHNVIADLAQEDHRSVSNMIEKLLLEALAARGIPMSNPRIEMQS